jgi:hypothetical protein
MQLLPLQYEEYANLPGGQPGTTGIRAIEERNYIGRKSKRSYPAFAFPPFSQTTQKRVGKDCSVPILRMVLFARRIRRRSLLALLPMPLLHPLLALLDPRIELGLLIVVQQSFDLRLRILPDRPHLLAIGLRRLAGLAVLLG